MPVVIETVAGIRSALRSARSDTAASERPTVALVPTLGALHEGHLALVERARAVADVVVVSVFVNPLQFGAGEDFARYPRDLAGDVARLESLGVEFVFAPSGDEMYPTGPTETRVSAGRIGGRYEGRSRPGHFDGVLTVVLKLLNIVRPDTVVFGQKDGQQVFLVRQMVRELDLDVAVEIVDTVREHDGLARSSRNRFLDQEERASAGLLNAALAAAESSADRGVDAVIAGAQSVLTGDPVVELDYLAVVEPATFLPVDSDYRGRAVVLVAAKLGDTRLIDNTTVHVG